MPALRMRRSARFQRASSRGIHAAQKKASGAGILPEPAGKDGCATDGCAPRRAYPQAREPRYNFLELRVSITSLSSMAAGEIDVRYVAHLARLTLSPEEEQKLSAQLGDILGYIEKLKEVDVTGVEPTANAFPLINVTRADEIQPSMTNEDALRNAPVQANGLFIVPKIVE